MRKKRGKGPATQRRFHAWKSLGTDKGKGKGILCPSSGLKKEEKEVDSLIISSGNPPPWIPQSYGPEMVPKALSDRREKREGLFYLYLGKGEEVLVRLRRFGAGKSMSTKLLLITDKGGGIEPFRGKSLGRGGGNESRYVGQAKGGGGGGRNSHSFQGKGVLRFQKKKEEKKLSPE